MSEATQKETTEETGIVSTITGAFGGYVDAVLEQPIQHGLSVLVGMGIDRRLVTAAAKAELSDQAYAKMRSKVFLGGLPLINA